MSSTGVIAIVRAVQTGLSIHGPGGGDTSCKDPTLYWSHVKGTNTSSRRRRVAPYLGIVSCSLQPIF